jgi:hypothetical protein
VTSVVQDPAQLPDQCAGKSKSFGRTWRASHEEDLTAAIAATLAMSSLGVASAAEAQTRGTTSNVRIAATTVVTTVATAAKIAG